MFERVFILSFLFVMNVSHVFAAGSSHHGGSAHAGHGESSGGLPQLDPSSFASQTFWLFIVFTLLYVFFAKRSLPEISQTIENRTERIKNDLDTAERLKEEVATVQHSYEESLKKAREESSILYMKIENEIKAKTEGFNKEFLENSKNKISEFEKNISEARKNAMEDMNQIAAEIAMEAAEKIIGVRTDEKSAKAVVSSLSKAA